MKLLNYCLGAYAAVALLLALAISTAVLLCLMPLLGLWALLAPSKPTMLCND